MTEMPKNQFLAVFFGLVHSIGLLGQPKTSCGCQSIQKKAKKPDWTGPLNTMHMPHGLLVYIVVLFVLASL